MIKNIFNLGKKNKELFKEMYETNFNSVYSFVFARITNNEITEDIVQETFISAMNGWNSYKGISSHKTWLCGIAKNKILNYYRDTLKKETLAFSDELDSIESDEDIELIVINAESRNVIFQILNSLKPIYRYVLTLKYMDNYSVRQISKYLNKTPKSIDGILQRAKLSFKNEYIRVSNGYFETDSFEKKIGGLYAKRG